MVFLCLKTKAVAAFWDVEKIKQMEEWNAEYLAPSSQAAMAINKRDQDQRAEHRHYDGSVTVQGTVRSVRSEASTKRRESNGSDVQWRRARPQKPPGLGFAEW